MEDVRKCDNVLVNTPAKLFHNRLKPNLSMRQNWDLATGLFSAKVARVFNA